MEPTIDGYLYNATIENWFAGEQIVTGTIFGDRKRRFPDGERIHTSYIVEQVKNPRADIFPFAGDVITRNSRYRIINWRK